MAITIIVHLRRPADMRNGQLEPPELKESQVALEFEPVVSEYFLSGANIHRSSAVQSKKTDTENSYHHTISFVNGIEKNVVVT